MNFIMNIYYTALAIWYSIRYWNIDSETLSKIENSGNPEIEPDTVQNYVIVPEQFLSISAALSEVLATLTEHVLSFNDDPIVVAQLSNQINEANKYGKQIVEWHVDAVVRDKIIKFGEDSQGRVHLVKNETGSSLDDELVDLLKKQL